MFMIQVDTASGRWRDAGDGNGIVAMEPTDEDNHEDEGFDKTLAKRHTSASPSPSASNSASNTDLSSLSSDSSASYSADSDLQEDEAVHNAVLDKQKDRNWVEKKIHGVTPSGIRNAILRKTVRSVASFSTSLCSWVFCKTDKQTKHMDLC